MNTLLHPVNVVWVCDGPGHDVSVSKDASELGVGRDVPGHEAIKRIPTATAA